MTKLLTSTELPMEGYIDQLRINTLLALESERVVDVLFPPLCFKHMAVHIFNVIEYLKTNFIKSDNPFLSALTFIHN